MARTAAPDTAPTRCLSRMGASRVSDIMKTEPDQWHHRTWTDESLPIEIRRQLLKRDLEQNARGREASKASTRTPEAQPGQGEQHPSGAA